MYQPKTGQPCGCKRGVARDNCPSCEGTGWRVDFRAIHARREQTEPPYHAPIAPGEECPKCRFIAKRESEE